MNRDQIEGWGGERGEIFLHLLMLLTCKLVKVDNRFSNFVATMKFRYYSSSMFSANPQEALACGCIREEDREGRRRCPTNETCHVNFVS